jgi:hypothetical protein
MPKYLVTFRRQAQAWHTGQIVVAAASQSAADEAAEVALMQGAVTFAPDPAAEVDYLEAATIQAITPLGEGYVARFVPQAWINDNAIEVDPRGETHWTPAILSDAVREDADEAAGSWVMDVDDTLKLDAAAPAWVREWDGPFSLWVKREDAPPGR